MAFKTWYGHQFRVGIICPPGWNRVKVSENFGATAVAPVTPADTSLAPIKSKEIYFRDKIPKCNQDLIELSKIKNNYFALFPTHFFTDSKGQLISECLFDI